MSARRTRIGFETVKGFSTLEEAIAFSNRLKKYLLTYCHEEKAFLACYIGISQHPSHEGMIVYGFRGKKVFRPYGTITRVIPPHLHIVYLGNPGETIGQRINEYCTEKGYKPFHSSCEDETVNNILRYTMFQSTKHRTAAVNVDKLPQDALSEFLKLAEGFNRKMNGNEPVFELPMSEKFFNADDTVLSDIHCEVFTNMRIREQAAEQARKLNKAKATANSVTNGESFTAVNTSNKEGNIACESACASNDEVFTEDNFYNDSQNHKNTLNNNGFSGLEFTQNTPHELQCNIYNINNNLEDYNSTKETYTPSSKNIKSHSPPIPKNVIDGLVCFLEALLPIGEIF